MKLNVTKTLIDVELEKAIVALGGAPAGKRTLAEIYHTLQAHGAKSDLLSIVGSYHDTQTDDWVLEQLRRWNAAREDED